MSHLLLERVRAVGRSGRRLMMMYGVSCMLTIVVATALLLGLADFFLRFSDAGVRWLCFGILVVAWVLGAYCFLLPPLRIRRTEVQVARLIERRFPALGDQLSSAVAFLGQPEEDSTAGSAALRRRVIADTTANLQPLNLHNAVTRRTPLRALAASALVCLLAAGTFAFDPASSSLAARRLLAPWREQAWPKRNQLQFVDTPNKLAVATDFSAEVIDASGRFPDEVSFEYRFAGESEVHVKRMKLNRRSMRYSYQLTNVDRSFEFRAAGGDDATAWHELAVVSPTRVTSLKLRIEPPSYTSWPTEESDGHVRALVGSRVALRAIVSSPLSRVVMHFEDNSENTEIPLRLSNDGLSFQTGEGETLPWIITTSGSYWFEMTEREDPVNAEPREYEVRAMADVPPKILLDTPGKHSYVTRNAVVAFRGAVEDDLGIQSVDLEFWNQATETTKPQSPIALFRSMSTGDAADPASNESERATTFLIDYSWDLGRQSWVHPGDTVAIRLVARDFKPQPSNFQPRQLSIITTDELLDRIGRRQSYVLEQLAEALRIQRQVRTEVHAIMVQITDESIDVAPLNQLEGVELRQRRVQRILAGQEGGVVVELEELIRQMDANRVDDPGPRQRLVEMLAEVRRIDRDHLTQVQRDLVQSIEQTRDWHSQANLDPALITRLDQSVRKAGHQQDQVITSLEALIGELADWDSFQRVARELRYLRQQQMTLADDTQQHRLRTIGMDLSGLSAQQRTESRKLGLRQSLLAREFEKLIGSMSRMQGDLADSQPLVAEALGDAINTADRLGVAAKLRDAGAAIQDNRVSTAVNTQQKAIDQLREMLDVLSDRGETELGRRIEQLTQVAEELAALREQVDLLGQQIEAAQSHADPQQQNGELQRVEKEREETVRQLDHVSRRLRRLRSEKAAAATDKAANEVAPSHRQDAGAPDDSMNRARELLREAHKELLDDLGRLRQELAREQMVRLERQVAGLAARQRTLNDRTEELARMLEHDGSLARDQLNTLAEMARQQRTLALQTNSLAADLAESEVFRLGLGGATREMLRAAGGLRRGDVGLETRQSERAALRRLEQLMEALRQDHEMPNSDTSPVPDEMGELAPEEAVRLVAELKLLKLMQAEVQRRTMELESKRVEAGGTLSEPLQRELVDLAREQGRLADLVVNLSRLLLAAPEDEPARPNAEQK